MADHPDLKTLRRSGACLMAAAIHALWPQAAFGCGSTTGIGFFYDVDLPEPLKASDLELIERRIDEMRAVRLPFERLDLPIGDAIRLMERLGQTYKVELLRLLETGGRAAVAKAVGDAEAVGTCAEGDSALVTSLSDGRLRRSLRRAAAHAFRPSGPHPVAKHRRSLLAWRPRPPPAPAHPCALLFQPIGAGRRDRAPAGSGRA